MKQSRPHVPVITVDGPSGSGKGTLCRLLARELGWNLLDSGALYRLVGLAARNHGVGIDNHAALEVLAGHLDVQFQAGADDAGDVCVVLEGEDVTGVVRGEEVGALASQVGAVAAVRAALLDRQRAFCVLPGLVADGRDMGTEVFPEAELKVFLTASPEERAARRFRQLIDKGDAVSLPRLVADIEARDRRDLERSVSPLRPSPEAVLIDTTGIAIADVFSRRMSLARDRGLA
jgi:cytidylate kinase